MRFVRCLAVALALAVSSPGLADPLTAQQTDAVNTLIHDYLMNNPKVLAEALAHADEDAKAVSAAATRQLIVAHRDELERDPTSPVLGNPAGDVTVVEFFDYRCPYCYATAPTVRQLLDADKNVRLVLKEFPILGEDSVFASRVALVAAKHGKYGPFHDALLGLKKPTQDVTLGVAKSVGLDPAMVRKEAQSPEIDAMLKHNMALADTLKIDGTPTFIIGSTELPGAVTLAELQAQVTAARNGRG